MHPIYIWTWFCCILCSCWLCYHLIVNWFIHKFWVASWALGQWYGCSCAREVTMDKIGFYLTTQKAWSICTILAMFCSLLSSQAAITSWCSSDIPDSKVHGANMGPIWGRQDPGGSHVGPMNFVIWDGLHHSWLSHIDGLVQERRNSSALALELHLALIQ